MVACLADISGDNLQVVGCSRSGVYAYDTGTITLSGEDTSIKRNVTDGDSWNYGLKAYSSSSNIQVVHPLTKNQISKDNCGGKNWNGDGTKVSKYECYRNF